MRRRRALSIGIRWCGNGGQVKKILKHLSLWQIKARPPPTATGKTREYHLDDSTSQLPSSDKCLYVALDEEYISPKEFKDVYEHARRTRAAVRGFINYLKKYEERKPTNPEP